MEEGQRWRSEKDSARIYSMVKTRLDDCVLDPRFLI